MAKLPLMIEMHALPCLVVGGGVVATRKVELLLEAGADVTVVAPRLHERLVRYREQNKIKIAAQRFCRTQLHRKRLVVAASDDESLNRDVANCAEQAGILVNVVDDTRHSRAIFPSLLRRGTITVAVSSDGNSPVLARLLRSFIATWLPTDLSAIGEDFVQWRRRIKNNVSDPTMRQRVWQQLLSQPFFSSKRGDNEHTFRDAENRARAATGAVYLVGAGPGDPKLLTLRAWALLQQADVIVHDRLVSDDILQLARRDAERIYVGKASAAHTMSQHEINQLLIRLAQQGLTVVRLKGGDPFVFGRGGEEMNALRAEGIAVEIVPGITAALGCAAAAHIPLTHRGVANRVQFLTAHCADDHLPDLDWSTLHARDLTLVFYMGLKNVAQVCEHLIAHGRAPETPAAIISAGTSSAQKNIYARLVDLPLHCHAAVSPSLIVVGDVVTIAADYSRAANVSNAAYTGELIE